MKTKYEQVMELLDKMEESFISGKGAFWLYSKQYLKLVDDLPAYPDKMLVVNRLKLTLERKGLKE